MDSTAPNANDAGPLGEPRALASTELVVDSGHNLDTVGKGHVHSLLHWGSLAC